jgi:hypothetical protein
MNNREHKGQLTLTLLSVAMLFLAAIFAFGQLPFSSSSGSPQTKTMEMALARHTIPKRALVAMAKANRPLHLHDSVDDSAGILPVVSTLTPPSTAGASTTDPGHCAPVGLVRTYNACAPPTV